VHSRRQGRCRPIAHAGSPAAVVCPEPAAS
jgi:hypothetical protein